MSLILGPGQRWISCWLLSTWRWFSLQHPVSCGTGGGPAQPAVHHKGQAWGREVVGVIPCGCDLVSL